MFFALSLTPEKALGKEGTPRVRVGRSCLVAAMAANSSASWRTQTRSHHFAAARSNDHDAALWGTID